MVTLHQEDDDALDATAAALRAGGVVVIPTDTVYGLAALPSHEVAVRAIYLAKGRPEGMHLPVLVASLAQVRWLGVELFRRAPFGATADSLLEQLGEPKEKMSI